ncbi:Domain of unknown function (DUF543 [Striga hermonthica]|uniref:Uncharacterized protein n=1 Tax=Striga hermonthica TaxID=68872 RepID=A0A9N7NXB9_STRHE|nr:Domain of unknown function (DUF543 [Striga hermonthica]
MSDESKAEIPTKHVLNAKWDICLDLGVRRFAYSSIVSGFARILLFRIICSMRRRRRLWFGLPSLPLI